MAIRIFLCKADVFINFFYPPEGFYYELIGEISDDEDFFAYEFKKKSQTKLLKYVLAFDHVVFNQVQLPILKDDIEWALKEKLTKEKLGKMLLNAVNAAMSNPELYLKFEVD